MANKLTKREVINMIMGEEVIAGNEVYMAYLENELRLLDKKASSKKATKVQEQNVGIKATIMSVLEAKGVGMTVTEILKAHTDLADLTNQKVSALLRQLVEADKVERYTDKKSAKYKVKAVASTDEVED